MPSLPRNGKDEETDVDLLACTLITGAGATAVTDLWAIARRRLLATPVPDYGLLGRWIGGMARGRFRHDAIAASPPLAGERVLGWAAHYLIGIAFAAVLIGTVGIAWVRQPTLGPALAVGIGTVAAPFLVMQPAMGHGIAASRTRRPWAARLQSLVTHFVFGLGLYAAGRAAAFLYVP